MKSPSPVAAGALSLILGVGVGIWASGLDLRNLWKSAGSADSVGVAAAPVTAPDSAAAPAPSDAGEAGEDADTGEETGASGPEGWEAGSLAEIPDLLQRMRRGHMPESARRDWLVAEMMRLVERDGYDGAEFSKGWERAGFEERSLMSSARLEALARLRSE